MLSSRRITGSAMLFVTVAMVILTILGMSLMSVSFAVRNNAARMESETRAMLAAEAGCEQAIFWMGQQQDMLHALQNNVFGTSGALQFNESVCDYNISFYTFARSRPIYRITSTGVSGRFQKTVDNYVVQSISGWTMGMCRVPSGPTSTVAVNFAAGEVIDMPIHINDAQDSPDNRDIHISGTPQFLQSVEMGESRYEGSTDKYYSVLDLFHSGVYFDQPDSRITDNPSIQTKVDRFRATTKAQYVFVPVGDAPVSKPQSAVHLEFFTENNIGKVTITNNCTVRSYQRGGSKKTWDYKIKHNQPSLKFERYDIYAYHLRPDNAEATGQRITVDLADTYVTQSFDNSASIPGGQIFVDGHVIIGSGASNPGVLEDVITGTITVVATGNIWIADAITVNGDHDGNGVPTIDNPNILGLIAQGVIKVVDPGMTEYSYVDNAPVEPAGYSYVPIGREDTPGGINYDRHLPDPMILEAVITVAGGGWGAENVKRGSDGGRKEASGSQDQLILNGAITEAIRGVVSIIGSDGYIKNYFMDWRILEGLLPGDFWLNGKYVSTPAGWHDYRVASN